MATAPYRFIPVERDYVQVPPVARAEISFDKPLAMGSVTAVLNVEWTAKTPVCIGSSGEGSSIVEPLKVGNRYCLPGASLRGMIRSVLEIATFSHLGRINATHHHGVRDANFKPENLPPTQVTSHHKLKAGWLKWDASASTWMFYPANCRNNRFSLVPIRELLHGRDDLKMIDIPKWRQLPLVEKYNLFQKQGKIAKIATAYAYEGTDKRRDTELLRVALEKRPGVPPPHAKTGDFPLANLYPVFTDSFDVLATNAAEEKKLKQNEALFPAPMDKGYAIPKEWMLVFHRMHADKSREGGNPQGAWRKWLVAHQWQNVLPGFTQSKDDGHTPESMTGNGFGIPVFWKGETSDLEKTDLENPENAGQQKFWFGLSRVIRLPHEYSVGDAANRLFRSRNPKYRIPDLDEPRGWDFARSIFGEVDAANDGVTKKRSKEKEDGTYGQGAQRGRVAIGFAFAPENIRPLPDVKSGVFGQPRTSFWPFYARHINSMVKGELKAEKTASWSSDEVVPAGRKRALVRRSAVPFPSSNGNRKTETDVRFLPAGTVFKGQIRVHNLHPVEFGALLYALTFGVEDGSRWHQIGRAKGMGHGAISPKVVISNAIKTYGLEGNQPQAIADWIALFQDWMTEQMEAKQLPSHQDHPAIGMLEAMADPDIGDALARKRELDTGDLPSFKTWRDATKASQDGSTSGNYPLSNPLHVKI